MVTMILQHIVTGVNDVNTKVDVVMRTHLNALVSTVITVYFKLIHWIGRVIQSSWFILS